MSELFEVQGDYIRTSNIEAISAIQLDTKKNLFTFKVQVNSALWVYAFIDKTEAEKVQAGLLAEVEF